MTFKVIVFASLLALTFSEPVPGPKTRCDLKHPNAGLSTRYYESIAHAIHSMDLESLKEFVPNAEEANTGIPTVNMNLNSEEKVILIPSLTN